MPHSKERQRDLGAALKQLRRERGITQRTIARDADISLAHYGDIEAGRSNPTWGAMRRVAAALGTDVVELAKRANEQQRKRYGS
jgi:transcriptional regulator with XRE-family HTH domain